MQRVRRSTAVAVQPAEPAGLGPPGFFTGGNPGGGVPATIPGFEWFNAVQEELVGIVLRSGLALDGADQAQLRKALDRLHGGGLRSVTANTTLTADDAGLVLVNAAGGNITVTLPAASAVNGRPIEFRFARTDISANAVTIQRAGGDTIEGATAMTLGVSNRLLIVSDGASAWRAIGEATTGRSYGSSGWQRMPGGLIVQWGIATTGAGGSTTVTFPLAFPTAAWTVAIGSNVSGPNFHTYQSLSTAGFFLQSWASATGASAGNLTANFVALGS